MNISVVKIWVIFSVGLIPASLSAVRSRDERQARGEVYISVAAFEALVLGKNVSSPLARVVVPVCQRNRQDERKSNVTADAILHKKGIDANAVRAMLDRRQSGKNSH